MAIYYEHYLYIVIFGLLVAAIYFAAIKLRSMNEEYAARVKNGIKWMKISILLGILPYVIFWFFHLTSLFIFKSEIFAKLIFNWWSYKDNYPFIMGPFAGLVHVMKTLFPRSSLNMFISISLWLVAPLIIGFFIYKKRRNPNETANISADS